MSVNSRYRRERPYATKVVDANNALVKLAQDNPGMVPSDLLPTTQMSIAFAILDLSDAIREHGKEARR